MLIRGRLDLVINGLRWDELEGLVLARSGFGLRLETVELVGPGR